MDENYFVFHGMDSRELGMRVISMPPRVRPARRYEEHIVPGRCGKARIWDGAYEAIQLPVGVYLPYLQGAAVSDVPEIMRALDGEGWLTLSDRPGRKFFATVSGETSYDAWVQGFEERVSTLLFDADPEAFFTDNDPVAVTASGQFVDNPGNRDAEPLIELTGSGEITLMIGQCITVLRLGDGGDAVIDVPGGVIAMDGEILENGLEGDWPIMKPGANAVSWDGDVTDLKITVNARDIGW